MWGKPAREAPTSPLPSTARSPGFEPRGLVVIIVQLLICVRLFVTPWTAVHQASLSFTISQRLLKLMPLNRWCHPTISSSSRGLRLCLKWLSSSEDSTVFLGQGPQSNWHKKLSLKEYFWGDSLTSPFRPNLPLELMSCDWEIICTWLQFMRTTDKVRQRCLLPGSCLLASWGYKHPCPYGHVGSTSLSTPLTALMFFVELPKNVAVQLILLAGSVSQASVFAYLLAAWLFPRLE